MPMNSYPGQVPPPPSLLGRSTPLNTVRPSELLPGPSGPYADCLVCSADQSGAALGPPSSLLGRSVTLDVVGPPEPYADRPAFYARQSRVVPGLPRGAPIMANTTGQFGCTSRTNRIRICRTCCCTPCTKLLHTTAEVCFTLYIFKP
jgi:hypothetical protein